MSSDKVAVSVRDLSKVYRIRTGYLGRGTLGEVIAERVRHPLLRTPTEDFWALRDMSFDVRYGEVVGLIGRNGAGKSTALKVLSRITEPTSGEVRLFGRIGSLLEVGTGFHPELTGRENVYLNGAILGMKRREIAQKFDAIVEFAEVTQFLDTPVKRYSSGMYVRLAFSVAAHLNPEILIVDEVLAVGDSEFQKKCLGKMEEAASGEGKAVLFVSHNMQTIKQLCTRCLFLDKGEIRHDGTPDDAVWQYLSSSKNEVSEDAPGHFELHNHVFHGPEYPPVLKALTVRNSSGAGVDTISALEPIEITVNVEGLDRINGGAVGVTFWSETDEPVLDIGSHMKQSHGGRRSSATGSVVFSDVRQALVPGRYRISVGVIDTHTMTWMEGVDRAAVVSVVDADVYGTGYLPSRLLGSVVTEFEWRMDPPATMEASVGERSAAS